MNVCYFLNVSAQCHIPTKMIPHFRVIILPEVRRLIVLWPRCNFSDASCCLHQSRHHRMSVDLRLKDDDLRQRDDNLRQKRFALRWKNLDLRKKELSSRMTALRLGITITTFSCQQSIRQLHKCGNSLCFNVLDAHSSLKHFLRWILFIKEKCYQVSLFACLVR